MRAEILVLLLSIAGVVGCDRMQDVGAERVPVTAVAPDNTAKNERDVEPSAKTPIDQNENKTDVKITADIRKQIVNTANLSVNAQNVKVITADGKVTLRGPVRSDVERTIIVKIATDVAGEGNVENQLEVAPE